MPKLKSQYDFSNITDPQAFLGPASQAINEIGDTINGKLEFDSNIKSQTLQVNFTAIATDVAVSHLLSKTGVKYIQAGSNAACNIYHGSGVDTNTIIYLRSNAVASVTVILL